MKSLIHGLASASTSENLKGSAFGYLFSAQEFLTLIQNLLINPNNFQAFAQATILPSLVALIVNGSLSMKKTAFYLFWCLLDSPHFKNAVKLSELPLTDVFSEQNGDTFITLFAEMIVVELHEMLGGCKFAPKEDNIFLFFLV